MNCSHRSFGKKRFTLVALYKNVKRAICSFLSKNKWLKWKTKERIPNPVKNEYLLQKFANTFILLQRTIIKNKIKNFFFFFFFFFSPQNGQIFFGLGQIKNKFIEFSSFFAFKQTREQFLIQAQPLKMRNKK